MSRIIFLIVVVFFSQAVIAGGIPESFVGQWTLSRVEQEGFPWWQQVKYPVKLNLHEKGGWLEDQVGYRCELRSFMYDQDIDSLIFEHCGEGVKSSNLPYKIYQIVKIKNDRLEGEVRSYKLLFKWGGGRVVDVAEQRRLNENPNHKE